jgi:TRAP-type mannitol/chloroaromatic compound transport system permease small subunit
MLTLFPQILFLAPFSALIIRLALAILFALAAWRRSGEAGGLARAWSMAEGILAVLLIVGAWTQATALVAGILIIVGLLYPSVRLTNTTASMLALVLCFSLLITGAGAFAFDLPL